MIERRTLLIMIAFFRAARDVKLKMNLPIWFLYSTTTSILKWTQLFWPWIYNSEFVYGFVRHNESIIHVIQEKYIDPQMLNLYPTTWLKRKQTTTWRVELYFNKWWSFNCFLNTLFFIFTLIIFLFFFTSL